MTQAQFLKKYKRVCEAGFKQLRKMYVPYDTGNLANDALRYVWEGTTFHMYVNEDIAPYMVFTNEPWLSEYWHGKKNPNEGWWGVACEWFFQYVSLHLKGKLTKRGEQENV